MSNAKLPFPLATVLGEETEAGYAQVPCPDCIELKNGQPQDALHWQFKWWVAPSWCALASVLGAIAWRMKAPEGLGQGLSVSLLLVVLGVITMVTLAKLDSFVIGRAQFLHKKQDGWHIHRRHPLKDFNGYTMSWGYGAGNTIVGNVIRIRSGGVVFKLVYQLFTFRSYNAVFKPHLRRWANRMYLNFNASLWAASICEGHDHFGTCPPTEFVDVTTLQSHLFDHPKVLAIEREMFRSTLQAIKLKLDESPKANKASAPRRWIYNLVDRVGVTLGFSLREVSDADELMKQIIARVDSDEASTTAKIAS